MSGDIQRMKEVAIRKIWHRPVITTTHLVWDPTLLIRHH